jgi:hypothetical protein
MPVQKPTFVLVHLSMSICPYLHIVWCNHIETTDKGEVSLARRSRNNLANILGQNFVAGVTDEVEDVLGTTRSAENQKAAHVHAHVQESGNSNVNLNLGSTLQNRGDLEGGQTAVSPTTNSISNEELLSNLLPLLNRLVRENESL